MKRDLLRSAATGQGVPPAAGAIMGIGNAVLQIAVIDKAGQLP